MTEPPLILGWIRNLHNSHTG